ncbi:unnamed protein product [Symbiodinium necroappetens]|uniref:Potassium channel tetramerisation-type BTB domain-containing protein n=1 Tax=Symbiodinium necroappetens TaxID=1628268 RepID=A0A813CGZ8_9DINO|nr:unnamed protein product [Symbiodinium necroappetens]
MAEAKRPKVTLIAKSDSGRSEPKAGDGRLRPAPASRQEPKAPTVAVDVEIEKVVTTVDRLRPAPAVNGVTKSATAVTRTVPTPQKTKVGVKRTAAAAGLAERKGASNALKVGVPPRLELPKPPAVPVSAATGTFAATRSSDANGVTITAAPARAPVRQKPAEPALLSFNVGGQIFHISTKAVKAKPETLLAKVLAKVGDGGLDRVLHLPVDVCPDRFRILLDWFRYEELFVPTTVPIEAVLRDAARLELPAEILVNGISRSTRTTRAKTVGQNVVLGVVQRWDAETRALQMLRPLRWPGFNSFLSQLLTQIEKHFQAVGSRSGAHEDAQDDEAAAADEAFDFPRFVLPLFRDEGWVAPTHICSSARARVLALKLEELGYLCEFSDADLLVSLPLKLRCELVVTPGGHEPPPPGPPVAEGELKE